jgi:hypothetical protein
MKSKKRLTATLLVAVDERRLQPAETRFQPTSRYPNRGDSSSFTDPKKVSVTQSLPRSLLAGRTTPDRLTAPENDRGLPIADVGRQTQIPDEQIPERPPSGKVHPETESEMVRAI